jgi:ankyrin repeat protein
MGRALTPRTNLESLRKEAKRWLKALRAGDPAAAARLRAAWPGAPADPALRDVQHALARDCGLESWVALKAALEDLALAAQSRAERAERLLRHGWDKDADAARRILRRHPEVARFSLFTAAACGDLAEVERHLAADPEAARAVGGSLGWTALAYVAYSRLDEANAVAIARRLIETGADPDFHFDDGWGNKFKVLTGVIGLGEGAKPSHKQAVELAELLIAAGADAYDGQALYNISIVGADTDWYDRLWRFGEAAGVLECWREVATSLGSAKGIGTLDYLLGNAVGQNHFERARWLLERGADPGCAHFYTGQKLHALAQLSGFLDIAALLERHGAAPATLEGSQALQAACLRGDEAAARALAAGDRSLIADPRPLLAAANFGNARAVDLLLALGAPVGALDHDGISPLHRAVQSGSLPTVRRLIEAGADVDLRERRWHGTPLSWAMVLGRPEIAEDLAPLSHDVRALAAQARLERLRAVLAVEPDLANHKLPAGNGPTPLFCLPDDEDSAVAVARLLLAHGADRTVRDARGQTAADAARARGLDEAADLIEDGK